MHEGSLKILSCNLNNVSRDKVYMYMYVGIETAQEPKVHFGRNKILSSMAITTFDAVPIMMKMLLMCIPSPMC